MRVMIVFFVTALSLSSAAAQGHNGHYLISAASMECLLDNIDKYLTSMGAEDYTAIDLRHCPDISEDAFVGLMSSHTPDMIVEDSDVLDTFILVTRENLECLANVTRPSGGMIYRYFRESCRLELVN